MHKFFITILFLLFVVMKSTFALVDFSNNCKSAFISSLEFDFVKMNALILNERKQNPKNCIPDYIETYRYFIETQIKEEEKLFQIYLAKSDQTIVVFEKENQTHSPYVNYCICDIYTQQAFYYFRRQSYLSAVNALRKAQNALEKNERLYPSFEPNKKMRGIFNIAFGSIPQQYNWVLTLFDINASINQGFKQLTQVTNLSLKNPAYYFLRTESILITSFAAYNFGNKGPELTKMTSLLEEDSLQNFVCRNPLLTFAKMSLYQNQKLNEKAIQTYNSYQAEGKSFHFLYLDFMMGECLLDKLDFSSKTYFEKYLNNYKGSSYRKSATQKLAWIELLNGSTSAYKTKIKTCLTIPYSIVEADKQAQKEALQNLTPNVFLLKARLLFDGGYYANARAALLQKNASEIYTSKRDLLEFYYRMGRIYHDWGQIDNAQKYYAITIEKGKLENYYFAANAALQSGLLYEQEKNFIKAKEMFTLCLSMKYDEYQNSISQKAKAGLNRIDKK